MIINIPFGIILLINLDESLEQIASNHEENIEETILNK